MASDAGMGALTWTATTAGSRRSWSGRGTGEKVVLLVPADSVAQKPLGDIAADMMTRAGMNVDYAAMSFGNTITRRNSKAPVEAGGWSAAVSNPQGMDWLNPIGHQAMAGIGQYSGWYKSPRMQELRTAWLAAGSLEEQQRICRDIQALAFEEVPYIRWDSISSRRRIAAGSPACSTGRPRSGT